MAVRLLLASASPRRRELLAQIGIAFDVKPSAFEERMDLALPPEQLVVQNALGKALDVQKRAPAELILGADTVVVFNRRIYGKPAGAADAGRMLGELQGQWHTVYTGIALVEERRWRVAERATRVKLRAMAPEQIAAYVASGEPFDKAGSYAIQGLGAALVEQIDGCYSNVVGLSLPLLVNLLAEFDRRVI
jgi:septum formation protein